MEVTEIEIEGYEKVVRCRDEATKLHALIAVHDTTLGPALGGMRMLPYASEDEALFDVLRLSKGMTYKSSVAGLKLGGGKSVIIGDPKQLKSPEFFHAMGEFVNSLDGLYVTAEDMNIGVSDLESVKERTDHVVGLSRESGSSGNPSPYTAVGCIHGLRAVTKELFGTDDFSGRSVLIQGVGAVGGGMAKHLKDGGARVIICDIDEVKANKLAAEHGYEVVPDTGHHKLEVDIYAPCARGAGINDETIPELNCKAVAGCANNVLLETRHAEDLKRGGILYAPDYVINAGGIINVFMEMIPGGYIEKDALARISTIYDNLREVFSIARSKDINTREAAAHLAELRIADAKAAKA